MGTAPGRLPSVRPSCATENGPEHVRLQSRCSGPGDSSGLAMGRVVRPPCCRGALGDASPSYCHLHFDHEFGPPPFCGIPTLVDPQDAASPLGCGGCQGAGDGSPGPQSGVRHSAPASRRARAPTRLGCSGRRGRPGRTPSSCNVPVVAVLTFGEGWHNNHHAFPGSGWHGPGRYQVDVSWMVIRGLERLGLVWKVKVPTPERIASRLG